MRRILLTAAAATATALALTAAGLATAQASTAAAAGVTVNLASLGKAPNQAGSGFLYGLTQDGSGPADALMQPLRPTLFRGGGARIAGHGWLGDGYRAGTGYRVRADSAIAQARRVTAAPYNAAYHLLVSDVWGADTEQPAGTVYPCDNGDCGNWQTFVRTLVTDVRASGVRVGYDIWNEPDGTGFWQRGVNSAQYFQMWDTAVRAIRAADPGAVIVGPSYSGYNGTWLTQFVGHTRDAGTLPTVLNWHFGNDPAADAADAQRIQRDAGVGPLPMTINEYLFSDQQNPGDLAWYLARLTTSDVTGAAHAIWSDCCVAGTLTTALTAGVNQQPTGEWWTYRAYANLTGRLAAVSTTDPATTAAAAADQGSAEAGILLGTSTGQTGATTVTVTGIPSWLTAGGKVWVAVQRIPDQEPLAAPLTVSNTQLTVSGATITVGVNRVAGTDAYSLVLTPQRQDPPGSGAPAVVDGTGFTYAGTWGQANGIPDMVNGTANWSTTAGSTATLRFTGTKVTLHAVKDVDQGILAVRVDGGTETRIDDYAPARNASGPVWTSPGLPAGDHTLTVRVTGERNPASAGTVVALDYAEVTG
jgi:Glycosyl hydrolases family 39